MMETLGCGHAQVAAPMRFCPHLLGAKEVNSGRCLRGVGVEHDLACPACTALFKSGEAVVWITVCGACYAEWWEDAWDFEWVGEAQIIENPAPFDATLQERILPIHGAVFGLAADGRVFAWKEGELLEVGEQTRRVMRVEWPAETIESWRHPSTPRLLVSQGGRFAALLNDYRRFGTVVDLQNGAVTLHLDRGEYHPDTTPFPGAFFQHQGRELLVHASAWNCLDISNPQNGELLTARPDPEWVEGERPEHYLDYFHGRLHVSPLGHWVLDDGWVWAPVGVPAWWSLKAWLEHNVWESEDGSSRVRRAESSYRWNRPMCWVGDERVAIGNIGEDDEAMIDGARIFDSSGKELLVFAGPKGEFWSDGRRLFSLAEDGLQIWDVESGARTGVIEGFQPGFGIEGALVEIRDGVMRRWNYSGIAV